MNIIKITKKKNNEYQLLLDNNLKTDIYDDTIINYNLLGKKTIDEKVFKEIIEFNDKLKAYYYSLKYLNTKLRTKIEIINKLKSLKYDKNSIDYAINRLEKEGYLNEVIYIKSYINDQILLTLNGPKKIINNLAKLGFKEDIINTYLCEYNDLWIERINKIISKKIKANHNLSKKMLELKVKNDLINLGYYQQDVNEQISNINVIDDNIILDKLISKEINKLSKKYQNDELYNKVKYNLYKKGFNISNIDDILQKYL